MNGTKTLTPPGARQIMMLLLSLVFLVFLGGHLLGSPLPAALQEREDLLILALTGTGLFLLAGCVYSWLCQAHIQSYLCAVCILMAVAFAYQFFFGGYEKFVKLAFGAVAVGVVVYVVYRRINIPNDRLFWLCAGGILFLLVANLIFGNEENGARLWVRVGSVSFQPGELVKVMLIVLGASAFRNPMRSIVYCVVALISCAVLLYLRDLGGVAVIFALFVLTVYLLFDSRLLAIALITAAVIGLMIAIGAMPYAAARFENWGHAMDTPNSYQQRQFMTGVLMGGFKGLGTADHDIFTRTFAASSDGAIAGVMAVLGVPVVLITLAAYALLAAQAALNHSVFTSGFLILAQLGVYIGVQVMLNFGGAVDVLPFTGVVAPVIADGGSAAVCFGILLGLGAAALNPKVEYYRKQ